MLLGEPSGFCRIPGEGIYRRDFEGGGNIRLEFKGVSHTAVILLDGEEIAQHYNAYTSFSVIIRNLPEESIHWK